VKLTCPECGTPAEAANIHLDRMVAKCANCNAVWSFDEQFAQQPAPTLDEMPVPRPTDIKMDDTGGELMFSWRSSTIAGIILGIFAVLWNGFMLVWFGIAVATRAWFMLAFGSLHAVLGLGMGYMALGAIINTATLRVNASEITLRHAPLPWFGNRRLDTASIAQLYTKEVFRRSRRSVSTNYEIHAATRDGRDLKLVSLSTSEQALFVEQEIERYLRIANQPVRGEYSG
jgi:hypothetical protein